MESLVELLERLGYMMNDVDFEAIYREVVPKYQEYLKDRMSVPEEWRAMFDLQQRVSNEVINEMSFQTLLGDQKPAIMKPKDDEAFRLFRETDINF